MKTGEFDLKRIEIEGDFVITIGNKHEKLTETNFFDLTIAKKGLFYMSFNAGVCRLLVPDCNAAEFLREIETAQHAVLSLGILGGRKMAELMFEDNSSAPFSIHIQQDMIDRIIEPGRLETSLYIYTRKGEHEKNFVLYIRTVIELPYLQPW